MPQSKKAKPKATTKKKGEPEEEKDEDEIEKTVVPKIIAKKAFDFDPVVEEPLEKVAAVDDEVVEGSEAGEDEDTPDFDEEELNPFNDKWEE